MFIISMRNTVTSAHARQQRLERLTKCFMENKESAGNILADDPALSEQNQAYAARRFDSTTTPATKQSGVSQ